MSDVVEPDRQGAVPGVGVVSRDGRRERRQRGRAAVIDAVFELLQDGHSTLETDAIVERSGVSLSSLFRYFDNLEDLQRQAIETHFDRHAALFEIPAIGEGPPLGRTKRLVDSRLDLYEAIAPVARLARAKAHQHPPLADSLQQTRQQFTDQIRSHYAPELGDRSPAAARDLADVIVTLTSFEAWDLLADSSGRTRRQIRRTWLTALETLLVEPATGTGPPGTDAAGG